MLRGKTALITGSLDGIGYAIAEALADKGCAVMLNGFGDAALVQARVAALRGRGVKADYHGADISDLSQIETMVKATQSRLGSIDILVNNAVTRHNAAVEELPVDKWNYAVAVNLSAPFHLIRLTIAGMKQRRWGRIINLASAYGLIGTANRSDYVTTKHGLVGLTRVVALEAAPFNVTCNALCPALVGTPNTRKLVAERQAAGGLSAEDAEAELLDGRQATGRMVMPKNVGALAAFLCSEEAADMTGTPIPIDGAWLSR
jgi:3-hydroxybutyrate dehydrogenase